MLEIYASWKLETELVGAPLSKQELIDAVCPGTAVVQVALGDGTSGHYVLVDACVTDEADDVWFRYHDPSADATIGIPSAATYFA